MKVWLRRERDCFVEDRQICSNGLWAESAFAILIRVNALLAFGDRRRRVLSRQDQPREASKREGVAFVSGFFGIREDFGRLVEAIDGLREVVEVTRTDAAVLDPRGRLEAMKANLDATVWRPPYEHRSRRKVPMEDAGSVAVSHGFHDLLEDAEPFVECQVGVLSNEGV